jgi:tetratricopeptide (TPR) repeat protein
VAIGYFERMKHFAAVIVMLLAVALPQMHAQQTPDDQYIAIYNLMQQADSLAASGQPRQALAAYTRAHDDLTRFQKVYPEWDNTIVKFRLNYLANQISSLTAQLPRTNQPPSTTAAPTNATSSPGLQEQLGALQAQVQNLQADNQDLQAKLKEALSERPAMVDTGELAKAQAQVQSLMKDNDLLKAELAQAGTGTSNATVAAKKPDREVADLRQKLAAQTEHADKLAAENQALQARLQPLLESSNSLAVLRDENAMLKKQLAGLMAATNAPGAASAEAELAKLRAQIAVLQSDAEVHKLEKAALEKRIRQLEARKGGGAASPGTGDQSAASRSRRAMRGTQAAPDAHGEMAIMLSAPPGADPGPTAGEKSVSELPSGSAALVAEAQNYFSAKQYDKAEADYRQILQRDPTNALALANLAAIELEEDKLADAEIHIQAALAQSPNDAYNLSTYGYLKYREQKFDEALKALSRAAKLDPSNPQIQNYLGVTLSHMGLQAEAEAALRKAIELDPGYGAAHNNLAVIYLNDNPPAPALARLEYQKALDNGEPRSPELEKMLAEKGAPVSQ